MYSNFNQMVEDLNLSLDQLLENGRVLKEIVDREELMHEYEALKKTQESLIEHSKHVCDLIQKEKLKTRRDEKRIEDVRKKFMLVADLNADADKCAIASKRQKKPATFGHPWRRQKAAKARIASSN